MHNPDIKNIGGHHMLRYMLIIGDLFSWFMWFMSII